MYLGETCVSYSTILRFRHRALKIIPEERQAEPCSDLCVCRDFPYKYRESCKPGIIAVSIHIRCSAYVDHPVVTVFFRVTVILVGICIYDIIMQLLLYQQSVRIEIDLLICSAEPHRIIRQVRSIVYNMLIVDKMDKITFLFLS